MLSFVSKQYRKYQYIPKARPVLMRALICSNNIHVRRVNVNRKTLGKLGTLIAGRRTSLLSRFTEMIVQWPDNTALLQTYWAIALNCYTHTRTHARKHARTHAHTHIYSILSRVNSTSFANSYPLVRMCVVETATLKHHLTSVSDDTILLKTPETHRNTPIWISVDDKSTL